MDLNKAIEKHVEWKVRLRAAIAKQEKLDAHTIGKDDCCELGKWLYGEGRQQFGGTPIHANCIERHANFHKEAGKVANVINAKQYAEATAMIGPASPYIAASNDVGLAIVQFMREVRT